VRIEGPAVEDVQRRFRERWVSEGGDAFAEAGTVDGEPRNPAHPTFPRLDPRPGGLPVRIVDTTPGARFAFHATVLSLIRSAKRTVHLMSPYFSSPEALGAITDAARRGVHVVFTLPDQRNDSIDFLYAGRLWYGELIEAGVEVYEYQNHMSHAKVAVVDDTAVVGSANLNHSSFFHHYELAAVIEDAAFARDMRAALWERDRPWSRRIRPVDLPGLLDINAVCELYLRGIVHRQF
jgi:cardiolipin synthase